jgi:DNA-binding CsgD family transcriptional regulator
VLDLKCRSGMTALQVARRLGIAEQSVKNHLMFARQANKAVSTEQLCAYFLTRKAPDGTAIHRTSPGSKT